MYGFLLGILVLDGLFLGVVILLQSGKGGGLAAMGGGAAATEGILGGRQATTVLTRATWIAGGAFMVLALVLSIMSSRAQQPGSILLEDLQQAAPAPEPILPGLSDTSGETGTGTGQTTGGEASTSGREGGESGGL
jgi:preprotein translocase subunit SecG